MGTPKNHEEWMVSYLCPGQSSLCHTDPWANNNRTGIAAKWGQLTTGISLACESGWAGKVRKKAFAAQRNNGEMKWKLGPLSTSTFPHRELWGVESSSQNPASVITQLYSLRNVFLLLDVQLLLE